MEIKRIQIENLVKTEYQEKTATVGELIKALQQFDPNLPVTTEGCDCTGEAISVCLFDGIVEIERSGH